LLLPLLLSTPQLFAEAPYLAPGHPDGVAFWLRTAAGSGEEAADLIAVHSAFQSRTPPKKIEP